MQNPPSIGPSGPTPKGVSVPLQAFRINLSTENYGSVIGIQWVSFLLICVLSYTFFLGLNFFKTADEETLRFQESHQRVLKQQISVKSGFLGELKGLENERDIRSELQFANGLLDQKSFSWTSFFSSLEGVVPKNISISKIQLDPQGKGVQVEGRARFLKDLTQFIVKLEKASRFQEVFLSNQKKDKEKMTQFLITFQYNELIP